jgi:hypothetical protein
MPTFADRECHVVSVTDPYGSIFGFILNPKIHCSTLNISNHETLAHVSLLHTLGLRGTFPPRLHTPEVQCYKANVTIENLTQCLIKQ